MASVAGTAARCRRRTSRRPGATLGDRVPHARPGPRRPRSSVALPLSSDRSGRQRRGRPSRPAAGTGDVELRERRRSGPGCRRRRGPSRPPGSGRCASVNLSAQRDLVGTVAPVVGCVDGGLGCLPVRRRHRERAGGLTGLGRLVGGARGDRVAPGHRGRERERPVRRRAAGRSQRRREELLGRAPGPVALEPLASDARCTATSTDDRARSSAEVPDTVTGPAGSEAPATGAVKSAVGGGGVLRRRRPGRVPQRDAVVGEVGHRDVAVGGVDRDAAGLARAGRRPSPRTPNVAATAPAPVEHDDPVVARVGDPEPAARRPCRSPAGRPGLRTWPAPVPVAATVPSSAPAVE